MATAAAEDSAGTMSGKRCSIIKTDFVSSIIRSQGLGAVCATANTFISLLLLMMTVMMMVVMVMMVVVAKQRVAGADACAPLCLFLPGASAVREGSAAIAAFEVRRPGEEDGRVWVGGGR